jgi:hypothetical protein
MQDCWLTLAGVVFPPSFSLAHIAQSPDQAYHLYLNVGIVAFEQADGLAQHLKA